MKMTAKEARAEKKRYRVLINGVETHGIVEASEEEGYALQVIKDQQGRVKIWGDRPMTCKVTGKVVIEEV